ncbi:hypothetical protein [Luteimonas sp. 100069]|uniref:hypothetical protein n=1 Tax=Luteimonas sp. 100069 TaxID=2006109 RepID=UPI000F50E37F|nr:hypothetical protein [Luteimonas sp. 100069]RPD85204.1 hypothetical protein EGK76_09805 [Luteimonas sp. 100069]
MNDLNDVVAALNARLAHTSLQDFYERRRELKGSGQRPHGLFQYIRRADRPRNGYAYHRGGRKELQFNVGFEDERYFRYGVAFSLQGGPDRIDPVATLAPRIDEFNEAVEDFADLAGLAVWAYRGDDRIHDGPFGRVPDVLVRFGNFIFIGCRAEVGSTGVTDEILKDAARVLEELFPLYLRVEGAAQVGVMPSSDWVARLAYNSRGWWCPAGAGEVYEAVPSYRAEHGFGHEDWLFRGEWLLDGWRYGFVQGVNKSRASLLRSNRPFNLRLFTMRGPGDRRAVAEIRDVECLTNEQAADAVEAFEQLGWMDTMRAEVRAAGGRPEALGRTEYAPYILNMRYRLENVRWLDGSTPLAAEDSVHKVKRYSLCRANDSLCTAQPRWRGRAGKTDLPDAVDRCYWRPGGWTTRTPEHLKIQRALKDEVERRYPGCVVVFEQDHIDLVARTKDELLLFEVKSDLAPLSVIRQALGQILEYALHPRRQHELPVRLVIVGRQPLQSVDEAYLSVLKEQLRMPLEYWSITV